MYRLPIDKNLLDLCVGLGTDEHSNFVYPP